MIDRIHETDSSKLEVSKDTDANTEQNDTKSIDRKIMRHMQNHIVSDGSDGIQERWSRYEQWGLRNPALQKERQHMAEEIKINGDATPYKRKHDNKANNPFGEVRIKEKQNADEGDATDWSRTSLTPEQENIMHQIADNGEVDIPMERKNVPDPKWKHPHLPTEKTGTFKGEPGNSEFIPKNQKALNKMEEYGRSSVEYKYNYPDFSPFIQHDSPWGLLKGEVEIPHMTVNRNNLAWDYGRRPNGAGHNSNYDLGNFAQADNELLCALQKQYPDRNIKVNDIVDYRKNNGLIWHECSDGKTMQLVPTEIHDACRHSGGVSEMKYRSCWGEITRSHD